MNEPYGHEPPMGCANARWTIHRILPDEPVESIPTVVSSPQKTPGG